MMLELFGDLEDSDFGFFKVPEDLKLETLSIWSYRLSLSLCEHVEWLPERGIWIPPPHHVSA